ncbi:MAG: hypothetical protein WCT36_04465 [Candidatus Gracilibacteria bacterium]|jgi:hypothetical protein
MKKPSALFISVAAIILVAGLSAGYFIDSGLLQTAMVAPKAPGSATAITINNPLNSITCPVSQFSPTLAYVSYIGSFGNAFNNAQALYPNWMDFYNTLSDELNWNSNQAKCPYRINLTSNPGGDAGSSNWLFVCRGNEIKAVSSGVVECTKQVGSDTAKITIIKGAGTTAIADLMWTYGEANNALSSNSFEKVLIARMPSNY